MTSQVHIERTPPGPRAQASNDDIKGWGADLDKADRPAYPMERTPPRLDGIPELVPQIATVEVLQSNERPGLAPVFGTTAPPSGLSGMLRRLAFQFSENDLRHWLILLGADRVNVVEGLVSDLARGHLPNIYKEMGGPAEFRYNRSGAMTKMAVVAGGAALLLLAMNRRRH